MESLSLTGWAFQSGEMTASALSARMGREKLRLLAFRRRVAGPGGRDRPNQKTKAAYFGQTNIERLDPGKTVEEEILDVIRITTGGSPYYLRNYDVRRRHALKKINYCREGRRAGSARKSSSSVLRTFFSWMNRQIILTWSRSTLWLKPLIAYEGAVIIVTHSEMILKSLSTGL